MNIRKLQNRDLEEINKIQKERKFKEIHYNLEGPYCKWVFFGAFEGDELVSIIGLFSYNRLPHKDYPNGRVAEMGGLYTKPKYRNKKIATKLIEAIFEYAKVRMTLDAIVVDSTDFTCRVLEDLGFINSTEHRQWFILNQ